MEEEFIKLEIGKAYRINSVLYRITKVDKNGVWAYRVPNPIGIINLLNKTKVESKPHARGAPRQ